MSDAPAVPRAFPAAPPEPPGTSAALAGVREGIAGAEREAAERLEREAWEPLEEAAGRVAAAGRSLAPEDAEAAARTLISMADLLASLDLGARSRPILEAYLDGLAAIAEGVPERATGREVTQNLTGAPGDPRWVRAGKWLKRRHRAFERALRGTWSALPFLRRRPAPPSEPHTRDVPARRIVGFVLAGEAAAGLADAAGLDGPVVAAAAALPASPAAVAEEAEAAASAIRRSAGEGRRAALRRLEESRGRAEARIEELFVVGGTFEFRAGRYAPARAARLAERGRAALAARLAAAAARQRRELDARRFAAEVVLLEAALAGAASPLRSLLAGCDRQADVLRTVAEGVREAGAEAAAAVRAPADAEGRRGVSARLEELEGAVRRRLDPRLLSLPDVSRPQDALRVAAESFVAAARTAAGRLAERYELPEAGERARAASFAARSEGLDLVREHLEDERAGLLAAVAESARDAQGALREAWEIVRYNLSAARAEVALGEGSHEDASELAQGGCDRAARRLEQAADRLTERMTALAAVAEGVAGEIAGDLEARAKVAGTTTAQMETARRRLGRRAESLAGTASRLARQAGVLALAAWRRLHRLGRQAHTQLQTLSATEAEAQRVRAIAAEIADARAAAESESLPPIYRWLFRTSPLEDPSLLVGRGEEMERLLGVRRLWEEGRPATAGVVGDYGSGKSSLLNCALAELTLGATYRRGQVDRRLSGAQETYEWLARFLGVEPPPGAVDAEGIAAALGDRREIVILESCERLFRRRVGGYEAARAFGEVMAATEDRIAWITTFVLHAWLFLEAVTALESRFVEVIHLEPLGRDALEEVILARHRVTGYDLHFEEGEALGSGRRRRLARRPAAERQEALRRWFFDDLHAASHGTIRTAILLWRFSLARVQENRVCVTPLRPLEFDFIGRLERDVLFALAAYVQHGDLRDDELLALMGEADAQVGQALDFLQQTRILEPVPGLPPPPAYRVSPLLYAPLVAALRQRNILHL